MVKILLARNFLISTITISVVYFILSIYLMNARLVSDTLLGISPITYKVKLFVALLQGASTTVSTTALLLLSLTAFLTGANLTLIGMKLLLVRRIGGLHFIAGGGSVLGTIGSGCATCGLPIVSLLGLSGSIAYLPFRGMELSYIAVIVLAISFYLLIKSNIQDEKSCKIPERSKQVGYTA